MRENEARSNEQITEVTLTYPFWFSFSGILCKIQQPQSPKWMAGASTATRNVQGDTPYAYNLLHPRRGTYLSTKQPPTPQPKFRTFGYVGCTESSSEWMPPRTPILEGTQ